MRIRWLGIVLAGGIAVLAMAAPAHAADPYPAGSKKPPEVLAQTYFNGSPPVAVSPASTGGGDQGAIAFTGLDLLILLLTALAALGIGFVLWRSAQHRPDPSSR